MTGISSSIPRLADGFQHGKAVNAGHVDIQQHNGDAGGVLFQQAQAVLAGSRSAVSNWLFSIWLAASGSWPSRPPMGPLWRLWVGCRACGSG